MLQVGARRTIDDFIFASSAKNWPTAKISSGSKVDAIDVSHLEHKYFSKQYSVIQSDVRGDIAPE